MKCDTASRGISRERRKSSTVGRMWRRTKGAMPRSSTICRPVLRSSKPIRWEVPGKKTLSVSRRRRRASQARGWRWPTSTAAAPPSPKMAVETTFVAERSERWNVRLENSSASSSTARSG
jgi:hypothetical protein